MAIKLDTNPNTMDPATTYDAPVPDSGSGTGTPYIKVGGVYTAPKTTAPNINSQVDYMKNTVGGKTMDDIYSSLIAARPTSQEIQIAIGKNTGISDRISGVRAQMSDIQKAMLGDHSAIFSATDPNTGADIDPRVKVAQYKANMDTYMGRLDQLGSLESAYTAELKTLSDAEQQRITAENERNKTALQYLNQVNDQKFKEQQFAEQKREFNINKSTQQNQFDETLANNKYEFNQTSNAPKMMTDGTWSTPPKADMTMGDGLNPKTGEQYVTVRNNNPTNMSFDVLKSLVGSDRANSMAIVGEKFTNGSNINYARFNGDGVQSTIDALDTAAKSGDKQAFYTQKGGQRWSYIAMSDSQWLAKTPDQKKAVIASMNQQEGKYSGFFTAKANTTTYDPTSDSNLTQVGSGDGGGLFADKRTGKTITGTQASALYGKVDTQTTSEPLDAGSNTPITYARRIKSMVPATLMNSELELKNLNNTISSLHKAGIPAEEAALKFMGVDLQPNVKATGIKMIDILKGTNAQPQVYTSIADQLNKGNDRGAVSLLENSIYKDRGVKTDDISEIGTNIKSGTALINRISSLEQKFGPIAGREGKWAQYVKNDQETQRLLSDMTNFVAKYRNGIAGTSVTANEEDFLKNIIPDLTNKPQNAIAKIQSNIGQSFNGLNAIRDTVGLPTLKDTRSSYDIDFRKQAYIVNPTQQNNGSKINLASQIQDNRFVQQKGRLNP